MSLKKSLKKSVVVGALMAMTITGSAFAETTETPVTDDVFKITYIEKYGLKIPTGFNYNGVDYTIDQLAANEEALNALKAELQKAASDAESYKTVSDALKNYESVSELLEQAQAGNADAVADLAAIKGALGITDDSKLEQAITNSQKYAELLDQVSKMEGLEGTTNADKLANLIQNATANTEQLVLLNQNLGELVDFTNNVENAATTVANKIQEGVDYLKENEGAIQQSIADQVAAAKAEIERNAEAIKTEIKDDVAALKASVEKNEAYVKNEIVANQEAIKKQVAANEDAIKQAVIDNQNTVKEEVKKAVDGLNTAIENGVGAEALERYNEDQKLHGRIDQEILDREAADEVLQGQINDLDVRVTDTENAIVDLDVRVTDTENAIVDLDVRVTENEGAIADLDSRVTENEGAIADLDGRVTENEDNIERNQEEIAKTQEAVTNVNDRLTSEVSRLDNRIDRLEGRVEKVGAMAAAMASLKTMGYDPEAPTEIAVGVGQYRGETGLAIGAFHYPNKDFMLNFSLSTSSDEVMGGVGATWKIGRKKPQGNTMEEKVAKAEAMKAAAVAARAAK